MPPVSPFVRAIRSSDAWTSRLSSEEEELSFCVIVNHEYGDLTCSCHAELYMPEARWGTPVSRQMDLKNLYGRELEKSISFFYDNPRSKQFFSPRIFEFLLFRYVCSFLTAITREKLAQ